MKQPIEQIIDMQWNIDTRSTNSSSQLVGEIDLTEPTYTIREVKNMILKAMNKLNEQLREKGIQINPTFSFEE